jgi:hypothetical protein
MFGANRAPILRRDKHYLRMDQNEIPFDPHHLGGPSGVAKNISLPMVHSTQPCTNLGTRLTLSPNGSKCASTWPKSPRISIGCTQNDFWTLHVQCKLCPYLVWWLTLSPNGPKRASTWPKSPRSSISCAQNNFQAYGTFVPNYAPILRRD